jgi:glycosyltransferase involved in cell wall biosynthesis
MAKVSPAYRSMLIIPDSAMNPKMGSGQRTAIFFSALKKIGPVDVVMIGPVERNNTKVFFPGCASFHFAQSNRVRPSPRKGLGWLAHNLRRFLFFSKQYNKEPSVVRTIEKLITPDHNVIVFRYSLPFCVSGLKPTLWRKIFVDVDDRDDQTFLTSAKSIFGTSILFTIFDKYIYKSVQGTLVKRLSTASFVWFAAKEDMLKLKGVTTAVISNVPYFSSETKPVVSVNKTQAVLFVGTFKHRPNQNGVRWFLRNCWPDIHRLCPNSVFRIVGLGNWESLHQEFPDIKNVEFIGPVDEIAPEYELSHLVISPLFEGGGSKIKVIEACSFSKPLIASTHSIRGFGDEIGQTIPHTNEPKAFIDLCVTYLSDENTSKQLGANLKLMQGKMFSRQAAEQQIVDDIQSAFISTT